MYITHYRDYYPCHFILYTERPYYRLYTIHNIPSLKCLDCMKIKREERIRANKFASSVAGATLERDVQQQMISTTTTTNSSLRSASSSNDETIKTFTPGESTDGATVVTLFTMEEKELIRQLLENATSAQEIEEIEHSIRRGILPEKIRLQQQQQQQSSSITTTDKETITPPASKRLKII